MSKYGISEDNSQEFEGQARFIVFGVGGGGSNAVEHMVQQGVKGVTFVVANTDRQALDTLTVPNKFQLGADSTRGLGAGANPEVGRDAAEADEEEIRAILSDYDMVFITAGMGGGTGTGAAPVVARIAKELGILTVAVVTTPFKFEGGRRAKAAKDGIEQLSAHVDSIITIPNEKLQHVYRNLSMREAFKKADDVLLQGVNGLAQTIRSAGYMNIDFNDIRTAMTAKGHAMMGIGRASGDDRARQAAEKAIRSPLLDDLRLENAKGLLINISAAEVMMDEPVEISEIVSSITDLDDGNIFYGVVEDPSMGDDIQVTVIATGLTVEEKNPSSSTSFVRRGGSSSSFADIHASQPRPNPLANQVPQPAPIPNVVPNPIMNNPMNNPINHQPVQQPQPTPQFNQPYQTQVQQPFSTPAVEVSLDEAPREAPKPKAGGFSVADFLKTKI